jgi:peptidoglycan/LPS O-acetylase OafA/YrhL
LLAVGPAMKNPLRHNNIDALRLTLAVLVILSHSYPLGSGSEEHEPLVIATRGQLTMGGLAVDWFFVLSGFLITQSWERINAFWPFMLKRAKRIYPGFLVAVAVCSWLIVPFIAGVGGKTFSLSHLLAFLHSTPRLLAPDYGRAFAHNVYPLAVNGSLWSIPYEFWCYIGVAMLGLVGLLRHRAWVASLFAATILIHLAFEMLRVTSGGGILGLVFGYPPFWARLLPLYLAGVVFYQYRERLRPNGKGALVALLCLAIAARIPHGLVLVLPTAGTYLLFYLAFTQRVQLHNFAKHGDISYGVYLYAFPIQQSIVSLAGGRMEPMKLFLCALPVTLLAGAISWYAVERHFLIRSKPRNSVPAGEPSVESAA